jgi:hypothetical protein
MSTAGSITTKIFELCDPGRLQLVRKRIREYLLTTLTEMERAERGADLSTLGGRIGSIPPPSTQSQAKFLGVLEGLYVAGQVTEQEVADWSMRSALLSSKFAVLGEGSIKSEVEWPASGIIRGWDPIDKYGDVENGRLTLLHVELYSSGVRLGWRLDLSSIGRARFDSARRQITLLPVNSAEEFVARSLLPTPDSLIVTNGAISLRFIDLSAALERDNSIIAQVRFGGQLDLTQSINVSWAGLTYSS